MCVCGARMRPVDDGDCVSKCHSCEVLLHVVGVAWWAASAYFSYVTHLISYRAMIVASYLMTYLRTNPPGRAGSQDGTRTHSSSSGAGAGAPLAKQLLLSCAACCNRCMSPHIACTHVTVEMRHCLSLQKGCVPEYIHDSCVMRCDSLRPWPSFAPSAMVRVRATPPVPLPIAGRARDSTDRFS